MKKKYIFWTIWLIILAVFLYFIKDIARYFWLDLSGNIVWTWKFFLVLIPAAIWDSINPCAFAIMFILLQTVWKWQNSKKRVILVWLSFILAIFLSYLLMWIWLYHAMASAASANILRIVAWTLWIIIWLANLKDYFWYWKYFRMEVPLSWRPKMRKIVKWITSPIWAFWIWVLISLFLLPCTSGPYITILSLLSSESSSINTMWYIYLLVYNLIFIVPMFVIMFLVTFNVKDLSELKEQKELNVENMHLITWIIMLALWIYIFYDLLQYV